MILMAACCLAIFSCKEKPAKTTAPEQPSFPVPDQVISYLPVGDLIREDIRRVDSFSAGILYKKEGGIKDSAYIDTAKFNQLAARYFLVADLVDTAKFQQHFNQTSLMDETSGFLNFIYEAKNTETSLRKAVVYIKPSLNVDKVDRVYLETEFMEGETLVQQKLTWVMEHYFIILTIRHSPKGEAVSSIEKVIWDPQSYAD